MSYLLHLLTFFEIYALFAMSMNLIVGYCGLLTLSHAGYFAIGAYAYAILRVAAGFAFIPAAIAGALLAALASIAISIPAWRLRGDSFVLATLAVQVAISSLLNNWFSVNHTLGSWSNLTNGPFGISAIPGPRFAASAGPVTSVALLGAGILLLSAVGLKRLLSAPWGRLVLAMRDDELALRNLGKNTNYVRSTAIAIACGTAGLAGSLYASYIRYVNPSSASFDENMLGMAMLLVGGTGNLRGGFIGAALLIAIPEILRFLSFPDAVSANVRLLIYGALLSLLMHIRPQGVAGDYRLQ